MIVAKYQIEKKKTECSEGNLRQRILEKLDTEIEYEGNRFIPIFTITKSLKKADIIIESYPQSDKIMEEIKLAIENIAIKPAKYKN